MIFVSSYCFFCRTLSNQSIMSQQINGSDFQCINPLQAISEAVFQCHRRFKHFQVWRLQPIPPKKQGKEIFRWPKTAGS